MLGGGGTPSRKEARCSGGGGIAEQEGSAVTGGGGIAEQDGSCDSGGGGTAEQVASAVAGGGGIAEHDGSAVFGGGGMTDPDRLVRGGGGIAEQASAVLGGGGMNDPERAWVIRPHLPVLPGLNIASPSSGPARDHPPDSIPLYCNDRPPSRKIPSPPPPPHFMIMSCFGRYLSLTAHDHETRGSDVGGVDDDAGAVAAEQVAGEFERLAGTGVGGPLLPASAARPRRRRAPRPRAPRRSPAPGSPWPGAAAARTWSRAAHTRSRPAGTPACRGTGRPGTASAQARSDGRRPAGSAAPRAPGRPGRAPERRPRPGPAGRDRADSTRAPATIPCRSVIRLTPNHLARSCSVGSRSPGASAPVAICPPASPRSARAPWCPAHARSGAAAGNRCAVQSCGQGGHAVV